MRCRVVPVRRVQDLVFVNERACLGPVGDSKIIGNMNVRSPHSLCCRAATVHIVNVLLLMGGGLKPQRSRVALALRGTRAQAFTLRSMTEKETRRAACRQWHHDSRVCAMALCFGIALRPWQSRYCVSAEAASSDTEDGRFTGRGCLSIGPRLRTVYRCPSKASAPLASRRPS